MSPTQVFCVLALNKNHTTSENYQSFVVQSVLIFFEQIIRLKIDFKQRKSPLATTITCMSVYLVCFVGVFDFYSIF